MHLINLINPKQFFRNNKTKTNNINNKHRSHHSSFSSSSSSSSSSHKTPTTVLPPHGWDDNFFDLVQAFKLMDKDNDGLIPKPDLAALLSRVGAEPMSQEEMETMLVEVADDGVGGCVSLKALTARLGSACEPAGDEEELRETFRFFDTDHDGRITAEELLSVFREAIGDEGCTLEDCSRIIAEVGKNGDGYVCFEDFAHMMLLRR